MHCDICDGEYNATKCFSAEIAEQINKITTLPLDCHLMTNDPIFWASKYVDSGANIITAQIESFNNKNQVLEFIDFVKRKKTLVGLAIEPDKKVETILPYVQNIDILLVMSVKTGASGQNFDNSAIEKIKQFDRIRKQNNLKYLIEVDGGINDQNIELVKSSSADIVVSGNFVFNSGDRQLAIDRLK